MKWMLDFFSPLRSTSPTSLYQQSDEIQCCESIRSFPIPEMPETAVPVKYFIIPF